MRGVREANETMRKIREVSRHGAGRGRMGRREVSVVRGDRSGALGEVRSGRGGATVGASGMVLVVRRVVPTSRDARVGTAGDVSEPLFVVRAGDAQV